MQINPDSEIKILVVDDEKGIRDGSERIISRMGCRVYKATNGEDGLQILEEQDVSIVLLDLKMPGIDGMEVLRRIRERYDHILVIIITGFATIETAIEAMKKGAYDFIPKPFEPDQLRIVVNRARDKIQLQAEARALEAERKRTLKDLDTEKSRLHTIVDSLPNGVMVTDPDGIVMLVNPAALNHLNLLQEISPGEHICKYVQDEGLCELVEEISGGKHVDYDDIPTYSFAPSEDKYLMARARPVLGERHECLGAVVNIADVTTMKVLDRLKSEFVAKVSHELRSPLSTIHEQLALVISDLVDQLPRTDKHLLSRAKEKTKGLISLIGDLLDLSRIESGVVCQAPKPVALDELLANIVDFIATRARTKNQTIELECIEASIPPLSADPLALESIFGNLITNAVNYTPEGGKITIKIDVTGLNVRVQVLDNGFGIEARYLDKIFERFFRVKNDKTRYITGTGLGLPIVKGLVESMGGIIQVQSAPEEGSNFIVLLPVKISEQA